jgi:uncharacterized OB-fold protein
MPEAPTTLPPIAEGLFALDGDQPVLIGSRCAACGTVTFPVQASCPRCTSEDVAAHRLATSGTLWTWTSQGFRPKSPPYTGPEEFEGYLVGYVELGGEVRVEGILTGLERDAVRIGMPMRTTSLTVPGPDGDERVTFAFAPAQQEAAA